MPKLISLVKYLVVRKKGVLCCTTLLPYEHRKKTISSYIPFCDITLEDKFCLLQGPLCMLAWHITKNKNFSLKLIVVRRSPYFSFRFGHFLPPMELIKLNRRW